MGNISKFTKELNNTIKILDDASRKVGEIELSLKYCGGFIVVVVFAYYRSKIHMMKAVNVENDDVASNKVLANYLEFIFKYEETGVYGKDLYNTLTGELGLSGDIKSFIKDFELVLPSYIYTLNKKTTHSKVKEVETLLKDKKVGLRFTDTRMINHSNEKIPDIVLSGISRNYKFKYNVAYLRLRHNMKTYTKAYIIDENDQLWEAVNDFYNLVDFFTTFWDLISSISSYGIKIKILRAFGIRLYDESIYRVTDKTR